MFKAGLYHLGFNHMGVFVFFFSCLVSSNSSIVVSMAFRMFDLEEK